MSVTNDNKEYKRLRSYLNPAIRGKNVDAVLNGLATASASLINNISAVNDQLYIATAGGVYLDQRLAESGIVRPPAVGLSDDVFRQIGIQVKNRKQVRDLINNLIDAIFGDEFVRASSSSQQLEPYNLKDGDTLIVNFDEANTVTITFTTNEFQNIAAAKAQEVADAITKALRSQGFSGTAISNNDGNGNYVELISNTIGPASSVTVLGGSAQNQLQFASVVPAGGNLSTQWTISLQPGGVLRYTWTGGANPQLGKVEAGNYVNIFGGGFASSPNEGSYTILDSVGGATGSSFFEILNPVGVPGVIVQGADDAVRFYNPTKKTLMSRTSFAAAFQTQNRTLQIFLPAATKVIRRDRTGSAHLHYPPSGVWTFNAQPVAGDEFEVTAAQTFVAGTSFAIGATIAATAKNFADAINAAITGVVATSGTNTTSVQSDDVAQVLTITYVGSQNIVASGPQGDPTSLLPNQQGPYMYDLTQPFVVSHIGTTLSQVVNGQSSQVINVSDSSLFPDEQGYIILDYGSENQEGPIPYIGRPSNNTLLVSPAYSFTKSHTSGGDVSLIAQKAPVSVSKDGLDYPFYLTDVVSGRTYAQDLINSVAATGINIVFTILYPADIGLGKWGTQYTEISTIWGP